ncbi:LacI family DNA-binding transcriptional regulator [Filimonas effusa]|uniref:LacI family transcriptional regulator n=1 Tax=Filimonas effusa TaxID=2508721 RepID=A0A4Q1D9I8_9BACT|nr:LacI family DNA-binding transcriptional regulator [Filimonas effusa]RXK85508.1 LacI family transcriptional regulator [Filimonas effusa]
MKKDKEITIYDIARELNISAATVSRGLQDHPNISQKTKQRIADLAKAIGYRSNHFASSLRSKRSKNIGVLVHELNSSFITSVLSGIEKITAQQGYDLLIAHSSESFKKEIANTTNLFNKRVDGLIASLSFDTSDLDHFDMFYHKGVPVVFFDRVEQDGKKTVVIIDNFECGYTATQHLINQGCRRIVHVTSSLSRNVYAQRLSGYKQALRLNDLPFDNTLLIVEDELSKKAGEEAAMKILNMHPRPDGAFITNDLVAAACMQMLKQYGISIPLDIAIVGFNNDTIGELIEPALTTINYPGKDIGELAALNLLNQIEGRNDLNQTNTIIVPSGLIVRDSSLRLSNNHIT